jgi:hypothetical protein
MGTCGIRKFLYNLDHGFEIDTATETHAPFSNKMQTFIDQNKSCPIWYTRLILIPGLFRPQARSFDALQHSNTLVTWQVSTGRVRDHNG